MRKVGCPRAATGARSPAVDTTRAGEGVASTVVTGRRSDCSTADAQTRFAVAPIHSVPSRPKRGSSIQVAPSAPAAAPSGVESVELPDAALAARPRCLGHRPCQERQRHAHEERRPKQADEENRRRSTARPKTERSETLIQHVVVQEAAEQAEYRDGGFGDGEQRQTVPWRAAIREVAAGAVTDAEPGHEGRDDERGRVDVAAGEKDQQALPDDLIQERCRTGQDEHRPRGRVREHGR